MDVKQVDYGAAWAAILALVRSVWDPDGADPGIPVAGQGLDWARCHRLAVRHGLEPLIFAAMSRRGRRFFPETAWEIFAASGKRIAVHYLVQRDALLHVMRVLRAEGVSAVPLKGAALAQLAYGDASLRKSEDIDLLVRRQDVERAVAALGESPGFRPKYRRPSPRLLLRTPSVNEVLMTDGRVTLDLHWQCAPIWWMFPRSTEAILDSAVSVTLADEVMPVPHLHDTLVYLCFHAAKHGWERLIWIADIAALAHRHPDLDWDDIVELAILFGQAEALAVTMALANRLFATPIPEAVAEWQHPAFPVERWTDRALATLLADEGAPDGAARVSLWRKFLWSLDSRGGLAAKWELAWRMAFLPTHADLVALPLPRALHALFFLLRPARIGYRFLHQFRGSAHG